MPQLYYKIANGELKVMLSKLVDDLLIGACESDRAELVKRLNAKFEIGTLSHTPGSLLLFGAQFG